MVTDQNSNNRNMSASDDIRRTRRDLARGSNAKEHAPNARQGQVDRNAATTQYARVNAARYHGKSGYSNRSSSVAGYSRVNYAQWHKPPRKRHTGLKVFLVFLILLLILAGVTGFCGYRLYESAQIVRAQANEALDDINTIKSNLVSGNSDEAVQAARHLSKTAKAMNKETDGALWIIAEHIPVYGEDITTVRVLTDTLEDASVNAIEPLCSQMSGISLSSLVSEGNTINVAQLTSLINGMSTAAPIIQRGADAINSRPEPHIEQLKGIMTKTSKQLNDVNEAFAFSYRFAPLVSNVLGANGPRNYLIIAQNNVETRATGGFYGAVGMMTIDNGHFSIGDITNLKDSHYSETYAASGLEGTYEPVGIVGFPDPALKDMGTNPDFPHVAQVFYDTCAAGGTTIDGVILVDPVFIQKLTELTGEFTASDGTVLNGSNLATVLMHDTYWRYENDDEAQDAFFTMIANDTMKHVFSSLGNIDMKKFLSTVLDASKERHLSIWFSNTDEQAAISELGCSGAISNDATKPVAGVYFTNESWSKLEWYLHVEKTITSTTENADGSKTYTIELSLTNTISEDEAAAGNWYVTGGDKHGNKIMYRAGDMLERVLLCAPAGGSISDVWTDGDVYDSASGDIYGLQTYRYNIHLLPGETASFSYSVTTSPQAEKELVFDITPLAENAQA